MADNSARIAELRAILAEGTTQASNDGRSATWDLDQVRAELNNLLREDDTQRVRRPRLSSVNLRNLVR